MYYNGSWSIYGLFFLSGLCFSYADWLNGNSDHMTVYPPQYYTLVQKPFIVITQSREAFAIRKHARRSSVVALLLKTSNFAKCHITGNVHFVATCCHAVKRKSHQVNLDDNNYYYCNNYNNYNNYNMIIIIIIRTLIIILIIIIIININRQYYLI